MKLNKLNLGIAAGAMLLLAACVLPRMLKIPASTDANRNVAHTQIVDRYGQLPLAFELNRGQTDSQVRFLARGQGYGLFLTSQEAVLSLRKSEASSATKGKLDNRSSELVAGRFALLSAPSLPALERFGPQGGERMTNVTNAVLHMRMEGANANARVTGEEHLPGKSNYFIGSDPKKWRTNIPTYAKVRVENVYPGVDLVYYGNQGHLEYDFVVKPGADPRAIRLALATSSPAEGSRRGNADQMGEKSDVKIADDGDLTVQVEGGEVRFHKPVIYQPARVSKGQQTTDRMPVEGRYGINDQHEVAFAIAEYDKTKPLVIDPVLAYSTYLSGSGDNWGSAISVDSSGNAYVTGSFNNPPDQCGLVCEPFPTTPGAFETSLVGQEHAFVTKINPEGTALVYSTLLGGSGTDGGNGIAVDSSGNAYVTGLTNSRNFPTVNPIQAACSPQNPSGCAFVTKLSADGSALVYSTYLGGTGGNNRGDYGSGIALDSSGDAYVTGQTFSHDFPTVNPIQATNNSASDSNAFVSELNAAGSALVYSTYLGGTVSDAGNGIAVDSSGNAYVTGQTYSHDFPTANPLQSTNHSSSYNNAFVIKLNTNGAALLYSTYLGGTVSDAGNGIAVDSSGNAYVTGQTYSHDFPTVNPIQATNNGVSGGNAFVSELNAAGSALIYSTYLGGSGPDIGSSIAVDSSGNAYVTGLTGSTAFPTANPIQATNHGGLSDAFVTEFNADGSGLLYSTYLGGSGADWGSGIAVDSSGNAYVTGSTGSKDFPVDSPTQPTYVGNSSAFVSKISPFVLAVPTPP